MQHPTPPVVMSQPSELRRSTRERAPLRSFADEQAYHHFHQQQQVEVKRVLRQAVPTVEASDSEEEELEEGELSDGEEDEKAPPADENTPQWTRQLHSLRLPLCTVLPTSVLPRHRDSTQLDFLRCSLRLLSIPLCQIVPLDSPP